MKTPSHSNNSIKDLYNTDRGPLFVSLCYALAGTIWILLSDRALLLLGLQSGETGFFYAAVKGILFILCSSYLIYFLVHRVLSANRQLLTLLQAFLDETTDAIFVKDLNGKYIIANKAVLTILNKTPDEVIGFDDTTLFPKELCRSVMERDRRILLTGEVENFEEIAPMRDGIHTFLSTKGPLRDKSGKAIGLIGIARDITARKSSEEKLKTSESRLRLFLEYAAAPIAMFDREMRYLYASRRWLTDYKLELRDLTGVSHYEIFPELPDAWKEVHKRCLAGATEHCDAELFIRADGSSQWIRWDICPWREENGEIGGILIFTEDITARILNENNLRLSEERYRNLVEVLASPVFINRSDEITFCNPAFLKLVGAETYEEVLGKSPFEFISSQYHDLVRSRIATVISTRKTLPPAEMTFLKNDGRTVLVHTVATLLDENDSQAILVICNDLTEREKASRLLKSIVESVKDSIITTNEHGIIQSANSATEDIFGYKASEILGKNINMLVEYPAHTEYQGYIQNFLVSKESTYAETDRDVTGKRKDGSEIPLEIRISEFQADDKPHFTGIIRDMTEKRRLEEQFRQAQKMEAVGRLAGGVAHDFNNLLTVINGYSDMLLGTMPRSDPKHRIFSAIRDAGERAASLTAQLLAFSRKSIVELQLLNINDIIRNSEKLIRRLIGEDLIISTTLDPNLQLVRADISQLDQLIMNLAVNARDAMPDGGSFIIKTSNTVIEDDIAMGTWTLPAGTYVEMCVSDTGCGMSDEIRNKIFEPFFTTKSEGKGTGLGLAVVYGVVKQSGGHIFVESAPGKGTTFRILLPIADATTIDSSHDNDSLAAPTGTETILIVEDDASVRKMARLSLEMQGYTVIEADSGMRAFEIIQSKTLPIQLVLSDIVMPMMNGRQLAEEVRRIFPDMKVLFMSGYTDDATVLRGISNSSHAFIQKPFSPKSLAKKIREVLDQ